MKYDNEYAKINGVRIKDFEIMFDYDQMNEIRKGMNQHIDISPMIDPEFSPAEMTVIRKGIIKKLDVSVYADPKFDEFQMEEIRLGLLSGIDVSVYSKSEISSSDMKFIRTELESGKTSSEVSEYVRPECNYKFMPEIRDYLKEGIDIRPFIEKHPEIDYHDIRRVACGIELGMDDDIIELFITRPEVRYYNEFMKDYVFRFCVMAENPNDVRQFADIDMTENELKENKSKLMKATRDLSDGFIMLPYGSNEYMDAEAKHKRLSSIVFKHNASAVL